MIEYFSRVLIIFFCSLFSRLVCFIVSKFAMSCSVLLTFVLYWMFIALWFLFMHAIECYLKGGDRSDRTISFLIVTPPWVC